MSMGGVIQNAKWPNLVLTETKSSATVDGQSYVGTDNQRWNGDFSYDDITKTYSMWIKNNNTDNYLAWDTNMKVVMNDSKYWWRLVVVGNHFGFQVPVKESASDSEASANATSFYTLELEADHSVILRYQEADLIQAQLWDIVDK
ncbi:hypothetical protein EDD22DRAFT_952507 [Suillus occidentalis]|nr:hypothetical protein EDD22DRAFT_952507 [Suillus occidentalis]